MAFNSIYLETKYPFYLNNDENKKFIFSNINHEDYNFNEYICVQELMHFKNKNANYYHFYIYNSIFDNELTKTREIIFRDIQKFNLSFSRLVLIIKNRYKHSKNDKNLLLENFKNNNIKLIQNDNLYNFDYFELYKIVKESFFFNIKSFPKTINIKNPYTNLKINYYGLILIYFELLKYNNMPELFYLYFKCDFCIKKFKEDYFINMYINNFKNNYNNFSDTLILRYISDMLISNAKFIIFNNLNDETKLKLFKKITLYYYLQVKIEDHFFLDYQTVTTNYFNKYIKYLSTIKNKNPFLGRTIYKNNKFYINNNYIN